MSIIYYNYDLFLKAAAPSVQQTPIVVAIELVCAANVPILALVHVVKMRFAKLWIIFQYAHVQMATQAIHSQIVTPMKLYQCQKETFVVHHLVG